MNVDYPVDVFPMAREHKPVKEVDSQKLQPLPFRVRIGAYIHDAIRINAGGLTIEVLYMVICFSIVGGIFGAVHCLAWNSPFPTSIEHILWRVSALLVTFIPGVIFLVFMRVQGSADELGRTLKSPLVIPLSVVYCLARACLLVLALATLRTPPYKAYISPSWTRYIPHIG